MNNKEAKEIEIREQRGLWKASSYIRKIAKRLTSKKQPIRVSYLLTAHRILFLETKEKDMAGKYRPNDPTLRRLDGTKLNIPHWSEVPNQMAILDTELKITTPELATPSTKKEYVKIIDLAARTSHKLACIHPFQNGNGRISRLLINFILLRAGLSSIAIKEDKTKYLQAMSQADKGNFDLLRRLIIQGIAQTQNKKIQAQKRNLEVSGKTQKRLTLRNSDFK